MEDYGPAKVRREDGLSSTTAPIYYINLATRPDRREFMERQFSALGLTVERINAVTPTDLTDDQKRRFCDPRRFPWLSEAELSCSLSHVRAFEAIIASGEPFGVVLEDDVVLSVRLPDFLAKFTAAPHEVDILRLEADLKSLNISPDEPHRIGGVSLHKVLSWSSGAAGYVISRRGALRAIETNWIRETPADEALFNPFKPLLRGNLVLLLSDPALCIQTERLESATGHASDLVNGRAYRQQIDRSGFPRRIIRGLRLRYDRDVRMGVQKTWHQVIGGARKRYIRYEP